MVSSYFEKQQAVGAEPCISDLLLVGESASSEEALEASHKGASLHQQAELQTCNLHNFATTRLLTLDSCRHKGVVDILEITCLTSSRADCENSLTPSLRLLKPCFHISKTRRLKLENKERGRWSQAQISARPGLRLRSDICSLLFQRWFLLSRGNRLHMLCACSQCHQRVRLLSDAGTVSVKFKALRQC